MSSPPKVSVVMSVYNGRRFLSEAVESIVNQTFKDFELIVVNDGSSDGSEQILESCAARDNRIRLVHQANQGLTASLNRGLKLARGQYIARLDADDIAFPSRLEKQASYLDVNENIGVVGTNAEHIDEYGDHQFNSDLPTDPVSIAWELLFTCPLYHPSVMMRKDLVLQAGGYDPSISESQDYDLWTRLTHVTDFANLQEVGIKYRWWGGNMSVVDRDTLYVDAASAASRLHSRYLKNRQHPGFDVARFFLGIHNEVPTAEELKSYSEHIVNLYDAFHSDRSCPEEVLATIKADVIARLEDFARLTRRRNKLQSVPLYGRLLWMAPHKLPYYLGSFVSALHKATIGANKME